MSKKKIALTSFSELLSETDLALLSASGSQLVEKIGLGVVRGVVFDVLTGKNLRDSTELLTRRRIAALNLAITELFLKGSSLSSDFVGQLPELATEFLTKKNVPKTERWLSQWVLGLTDKAFQNVLRDNPTALSSYREQYIQICSEVISERKLQTGDLQGELVLGSCYKVQINWMWLTYLLNAIGAQTLAIRGSEKAASGTYSTNKPCPS